MKHYHVGSNVPGYLPEGEPTGAWTVSDALTHLASQLDEWVDGECENPNEDDRAPDLGYAESIVEAIQHGYSDTFIDLYHDLRDRGAVQVTINTGRALPTVWWAELVNESAEDCGCDVPWESEP